MSTTTKGMDYEHAQHARSLALRAAVAGAIQPGMTEAEVESALQPHLEGCGKALRKSLRRVAASRLRGNEEEAAAKAVGPHHGRIKGTWNRFGEKNRRV